MRKCCVRFWGAALKRPWPPSCVGIFALVSETTRRVKGVTQSLAPLARGG